MPAAAEHTPRPRPKAPARTHALAPALRWFKENGWTPFEFQQDCWREFLNGRSGLLHAPTGAGKTLAALLGPALEWLAEHPESAARAPATIVWITPLRALAGDTAEAIANTCRALDLPWSVERRTGDTSSSIKTRQRQSLPTVLVTTPESLTILLTYAGAHERFRTLRCAVVDEWHELLGTKRGVQAELALSRLRAMAPAMRTWGLSATLGNIEEAAQTLVGAGPAPAIVEGRIDKEIDVVTLLPESIERFPWAGHIGLALLDQVIAAVERAGTTLLFTNTRSQSEIWFRAILTRRPDLIGAIALHHGSLDRDIRGEVESLLRAGGGATSKLRCVVCTSSLDLGVDFTPVDQVIQVGSPKGVARLIQRAGRSGHRPGAASRILGVPSHALELVEFAAVRRAVRDRLLERRPPRRLALDVLAQHIVTASLADGFDESALLAEVRSTAAYRDLTDDAWRWAMDFASKGGPALTAYPDFARLTREGDRWAIASRRLATLHRMNIGAITADEAVQVRYLSGRILGAIEESFIARLRQGDRFVLAGRTLEFLRLRENTAFVRPARSARGAVPRWNGGRMPLSIQVAHMLRVLLGEAGEGRYDEPELRAVRPLLELQQQTSLLPTPGFLLAEWLDTRDGRHHFIYPFAGRLAHEGLGAILALRLARREPSTIRACSNDYGIELFTPERITLDEPDWRVLLSPERLEDDLQEAIQAAELARRQFREIARIAGLTRQGYPGARKTGRQLQASSDMFFDVFRDFDPANLLLSQTAREVVEGHVELDRLRDALETIAREPIRIVGTPDLTPLSFPLWAESLRAATVSTETWEQRVRRMAARLEQSAAAPRRPKRATRARHRAKDAADA